MNELFSTLQGGAWMAFAGFGTYLAYKIAMTTIISVSMLKLCTKIIDLIASKQKRQDDVTPVPPGLTYQRMLQLITAAGMKYPITSEEWDEIFRRVTPK